MAMKSIFEFFKTRTERINARRRKKEIRGRLETLMDFTDENEFRRALIEELDFYPGEFEFEEAIRVWRAGR